MNLRFVVKVLSLFARLITITFIPLLGEVAHNTYTPCAVTPTHTTLVILEFRADDAVAARPHTLPLHTHRAAVRTALGPIRHLRAHDGITVSFCFFMSGNDTANRVWTHPLREYHIVPCAFRPARQFADIFREHSCVLGHPLNKSLHAFRVRLETITHLALLLAETLNWNFHFKWVEIKD